MHKTSVAVAIFSLLVLCCVAVPSQAQPLKIIAGTSLVEDIARDLIGEKAELLTLIRGSSCPGHETMRTMDVMFAANADIVLIHAFQKDMPQIHALLKAAHKPGRQLVVVGVKGSWLVPANQKQAVTDIAAALVILAPEQSAAIEERVARRLAQIDVAAAQSTELLAKIMGKRVVSAQMQAEFARWAGCDVAATYGRAEDMTPSTLAALIDTARSGEAIAGVIDNYQSGPDAGLPLALELKVPHVVLSNFPGSSEDATDYFSLLQHNVRQLLQLGE